MPVIYLASRSPRRRELLNQLGIDFEALLGDEQFGGAVDETPHHGEAPHNYVVRLAHAKANMGRQQIALRGLPPLPVLAADTTVVIDGSILGKPDDDVHARHMLRRLSARVHSVMTAVAVAEDERIESVVSTSAVEFRTLDDIEIETYVSSGEPLDKAGAYAIQGAAAIFVRTLAGSYSGIMGLPLIATADLLWRFGIASKWSPRD